ncbi:ubiquitin carboxyl-terminal hydrolase 22 [Caerostris darwini]|uniref:Ubiquitin carboxyl-terminal hydrolase n=1 Tax=Caerostris darwini TaxID=1538125 RepID=A0AAV4RGZ9_9ARAC|nr:ubiquitin carboxyl-terminal hydrolase 22 [Caerostris darwini]
MNSNFCEHVKKYKKEEGLTNYKVIICYFVSCSSAASWKLKAEESYCRSCFVKGNKIHACLMCVYFGCTNKGHIQEHAIKNNHSLSADLRSGNIFCFVCNDYVYDDDFEIIARQYKRKAGQAAGIPEIYIPWEPTKGEIQILKDNDGIKKMSDDTRIGLRGILNLGNTCFMNCIVQVIVHTPLLRDYFLSDKHRHSKPHTDRCVACEMHSLFQGFYSGISIPFVPDQLVYSLWTKAKYLVGNEQQDAHEFLVEILNALHSFCRSQLSDESDFAPKKDFYNCNCIIHQTFTGCYQSQITCVQCGYTNSSIESFWDISLDLGDITPVQRKLTIEDCLRRFTTPERVPCAKCPSCQKYDTLTKQLIFKKLPVVIIFHLKRLLQDNSQRIYKKISTHVAFPEFLGMTPFMAVDPPSEIPSIDKTLHIGGNMFTLFGVVTHKGDQSGGHYISYIRQRCSKWYLCDDDVIYKCSLDTVLQSEGYLLFYHKQILEYGSVTNAYDC